MNNALTTYLDTLEVSVEATEVYNHSDQKHWQNSIAWDVIVRKGDHRVNVAYYTGKSVGGVVREDVIYALISDSNTITDTDDFENWAGHYGYNSDSIRDKNLYDLCLDNTNKLNTLFTREQITILNDLYTDY